MWQIALQNSLKTNPRLWTIKYNSKAMSIVIKLPKPKSWRICSLFYLYIYTKSFIVGRHISFILHYLVFKNHLQFCILCPSIHIYYNFDYAINYLWSFCEIEPYKTIEWHRKSCFIVYIDLAFRWQRLMSLVCNLQTQINKNDRIKLIIFVNV